MQGEGKKRRIWVSLAELLIGMIVLWLLGYAVYVFAVI